MLDKVREMLASQLKMDIDQIKPESSINDDLGADSVDILQILMTMEEENGIVIPDEELATFVTVGDIVKYLDSLQK